MVRRGPTRFTCGCKPANPTCIYQLAALVTLPGCTHFAVCPVSLWGFSKPTVVGWLKPAPVAREVRGYYFQNARSTLREAFDNLQRRYMRETLRRAGLRVFMILPLCLLVTTYCGPILARNAPRCKY